MTPVPNPLGLDNGGDKLGACRMRRAFRYSVLALCLFTLMLWIAERYLRHELAESQYIMALTLPTESARAVLRQAVKRDAAEREFPTPKFIAALAEREEDDLVLPAYQRAVELDPANSDLILRYGCRLFLQGRFEDARERFREAAVQAPKNALPRYLEAAALGLAAGPEGDLAESLALVAKTNTSGETLSFPEPLWAPELPARGAWYQKLRRQIADECCAPLYKYSGVVVGQARRQVALKEAQYWDAWLEALQIMGERIAFSPGAGTVQATAGFHIQLAAIEQREAISALETSAVAPGLVEKRTQLKTSMALLNAFEDQREARVQASLTQYTLPLSLCWRAGVLLALLYVLAYGAGKILRARRESWTLPHSFLARLLFPAVGVLWLALLAALSLLPLVAPEHGEAGMFRFEMARALWWTVVAAATLFGFVYPLLQAIRLAGAKSGIGAGDAASEGAAVSSRLAGRRRRVVYAGFLRRYFGILFGTLLCAVSLWVIGFRVALGLYPWQPELLASGLADEEARTVKSAIAIVDASG